MKVDEIRSRPTTYQRSDGSNCHESLLRAFHIVDKVRELLEQDTPPKVVLEMIELMEAPCQEKQ